MLPLHQGHPWAGLFPAVNPVAFGAHALADSITPPPEHLSGDSHTKSKHMLFECCSSGWAAIRNVRYGQTRNRTRFTASINMAMLNARTLYAAISLALPSPCATRLSRRSKDWSVKLHQLGFEPRPRLLFQTVLPLNYWHI